MKYTIQTQCCYIATETRVASSNVLFKRSKLCNFCMTQNCSTLTNMSLKICLQGLFVCPTYSPTTHTSYALRNPYTCQRCYQMENLPKYRTFESTKGNCLLLKHNKNWRLNCTNKYTYTKAYEQCLE